MITFLIHFISPASSVNWTFNMIVSMTFLSLLRALTPYGAFWLYSALAASGFLFLFLLLPGKIFPPTAHHPRPPHHVHPPYLTTPHHPRPPHHAHPPYLITPLLLRPPDYVHPPHRTTPVARLPTSATSLHVAGMTKRERG